MFVRPGGPVGNVDSVDHITLAGIRATPLSVDEVIDAVGEPRVGGTAFFIGTVRDHDHGRGVSALTYSAHPSAEAEMRRVMEKVVADTSEDGRPVWKVAALHRVGELRIGDIAVVVAAAAEHREEAFAACRRLIDDIKAEVPIWKHQVFDEGDAEWVGAC
ncbi:molybdenum cofactor biosynthesis protein MoaE [Nocardiopsis rhodophaea]|uniref:Molybdenum cofactor biosynthesis protein MoaE n=1 Tax=Nocardiopsis rhodophaea TaxID=280238 RepID=A0ABP5F263_9ACTN